MSGTTKPVLWSWYKERVSWPSSIPEVPLLGLQPARPALDVDFRQNCMEKDGVFYLIYPPGTNAEVLGPAYKRPLASTREAVERLRAHVYGASLYDVESLVKLHVDEFPTRQGVYTWLLVHRTATDSLLYLACQVLTPLEIGTEHSQLLWRAMTRGLLTSQDAVVIAGELQVTDEQDVLNFCSGTYSLKILRSGADVPASDMLALFSDLVLTVCQRLRSSGKALRVDTGPASCQPSFLPRLARPFFEEQLSYLLSAGFHVRTFATRKECAAQLTADSPKAWGAQMASDAVKQRAKDRGEALISQKAAKSAAAKQPVKHDADLTGLASLLMRQHKNAHAKRVPFTCRLHARQIELSLQGTTVQLAAPADTLETLLSAVSAQLGSAGQVLASNYSAVQPHPNFQIELLSGKRQPIKLRPVQRAYAIGDRVTSTLTGVRTPYQFHVIVCAALQCVSSYPSSVNLDLDSDTGTLNVCASARDGPVFHTAVSVPCDDFGLADELTFEYTQLEAGEQARSARLAALKRRWDAVPGLAALSFYTWMDSYPGHAPLPQLQADLATLARAEALYQKATFQQVLTFAGLVQQFAFDAAAVQAAIEALGNKANGAAAAASMPLLPSCAKYALQQRGSTCWILAAVNLIMCTLPLRAIALASKHIIAKVVAGTDDAKLRALAALLLAAIKRVRRIDSGARTAHAVTPKEEARMVDVETALCTAFGGSSEKLLPRLFALLGLRAAVLFDRLPSAHDMAQADVVVMTLTPPPKGPMFEMLPGSSDLILAGALLQTADHVLAAVMCPEDDGVKEFIVDSNYVAQDATRTPWSAGNYPPATVSVSVLYLRADIVNCTEKGARSSLQTPERVMRNSAYVTPAHPAGAAASPDDLAPKSWCCRRPCRRPAFK